MARDQADLIHRKDHGYGIGTDIGIETTMVVSHGVIG